MQIAHVVLVGDRYRLLELQSAATQTQGTYPTRAIQTVRKKLIGIDWLAWTMDQAIIGASYSATFSLNTCESDSRTRAAVDRGDPQESKPIHELNIEHAIQPLAQFRCFTLSNVVPAV